MTEQIKYEAVLGDQELFKGAPELAVLAVSHHGGIAYFSDTTKAAGVCFTTGTSIAMRRIIKTPTWTKADQLAGKLPPVGSTVWCDAQGGDATVIAVDSAMDIWFQNAEDEVYCSDTWPICPVETDAERQQREREEWCSKALDSAGILSEMKHYELKRLGEYIGSIHDALLSGELKMPEVQK